MGENIKPCPFCGETATAAAGLYNYLSRWVECDHCNAQTYAEEQTEAEAIYSWNRRAPDAELVEALKAARAQLAFWKATADAVAGNANSMPFIEPSTYALAKIDATLSRHGEGK